MYYEGLQDKLAQIRDARGALNALREEHREKLRRAAEEAERQRQIQLAQKLEIMRQKKQVGHVRWLLSLYMGQGENALHVISVSLGIFGDAAPACYPAPAGTGEGKTDASGAAEANHPDESSDASFLSAVCTGVFLLLLELYNVAYAIAVALPKSTPKPPI